MAKKRSPTGKKKFGVKFTGFEELAERYDRLGGNLKEITQKCLVFIPDEINPKLHRAMAKHRRSGRTEKSIVEGQSVEWQGTKGSISVGFDISNGGLASIFLMYGTARHAPRNQYGSPKTSGAINNGTQKDQELYDAIYGAKTQREISNKQKEIFTNAVEKAMTFKNGSE